jgi:Asp-tRNA(Asn)/Glu-tRNA(Gln) amidotransferase A subunit family amidase
LQATKGATGLPLAVQLVGLPFAEASVLHVMKELELGMKESGSHPDLLHSRDPWKFAEAE